MISALTGEIRRVEQGHVHLKAGPILYDLLVPAADLPELESAIGREVTLHTIFYLAGDPSRGGLEPTLIGFIRADDRRFFSLFTTVKGIGPKTALRALTVPVGEIAHAIENHDARTLVKLEGIGKRTAELIIAELAGKVGRFAGSPASPGALPRRRIPEEEDAIASLLALGERRAEAERLLERAKQADPKPVGTESLLREMLRLRSSAV